MTENEKAAKFIETQDPKYHEFYKWAWNEGMLDIGDTVYPKGVEGALLRLRDRLGPNPAKRRKNRMETQ